MIHEQFQFCCSLVPHSRRIPLVEVQMWVLWCQMEALHLVGKQPMVPYQGSGSSFGKLPLAPYPGFKRRVV